MALLRRAVHVELLRAGRLHGRRWLLHLLLGLGLPLGEQGLGTQEVGKLNGDAAVVRCRVLAGESDRRLVQVLCETYKGRVLGDAPFAVVDLLAAEDAAGKGKRRSSQDRWLRGYEVAVVEGDLANVARHLLNLEVVGMVEGDELCEEVDGRVSDGPLERVKHVHLHLREHARVVEAAAHAVELLDLWHAVLLVAVLGGDEQSRTANELVVLLVHDTLGAVPVEKVDGQEQRLWQQTKGSMCLDEEVDEIWPHVPLNLLLDVNQSRVRQCLVLDIMSVFAPAAEE